MVKLETKKFVKTWPTHSLCCCLLNVKYRCLISTSAMPFFRKQSDKAKKRIQRQQYLVSQINKSMVFWTFSPKRTTLYLLIDLTVSRMFYFQAREDPGPLFDISDCEISDVSNIVLFLHLCLYVISCIVVYLIAENFDVTCQEHISIFSPRLSISDP